MPAQGYSWRMPVNLHAAGKDRKYMAEILSKDPGKMEKTGLLGHGMWNIKIWIGLGFLFPILTALNINQAPKFVSPYWYMEIVLYGLMLAGLWANWKHDLRKKIRISRQWAPVAYIFLVWLFGMMYEASLTLTGEGIGGVHRYTIPSFILAQGDYIPIAIVSCLVIRNARISFREVFFFAGGKSLTEALIFTGALTAVIASPLFFLAPIVLAYYTLVYSSFIALPLLFINEEMLWKNPQPKKERSTIFYWILGFLLALASRIFWGLVYSPIVEKWMHLPPNIL